MNRFLLSLLILLGTSPAFSQKNYFIYLQSENDQPFFVKYSDKVHSSSASGYLILSRLHDSSYTFSVGFPQNKFPEQRFIVDIKGKDRGFLLKYFGEKGWGLFDLQTLAIQMALPENNSKLIKTVLRDDISPFTEILAKAANDPSLKERPVTVKMEDKPVIVQNAVLNEEVRPIEKSFRENTVRDIVQEKKDSITGSNTESVAKNITSLPVKREQQLVIEIIAPSISKLEPMAKQAVKSIAAAPTEYKRSLVIKRSESSTSEGFGLVYIDEYADGKKDTIRIIIPNPVVRPGDTKELARDDKKFLDISSEDSETSSKFETTAGKSVPGAVININCKVFASEEDMVDEARKVFKGKCFTADQVKSLSTLFSKDVNKYKFFDAVYAYVSDAENFPPLSAELKDEYYIKRFKAMLR